MLHQTLAGHHEPNKDSCTQHALPLARLYIQHPPGRWQWPRSWLQEGRGRLKSFGAG